MIYPLRSHRVLCFIFITIIFIFTFAGTNYYEQSDEGKLSSCKESDKTEINSELALNKSLDQKKSGTCYAHAAYYLLQYLHKADALFQHGEKNPKDLALVDVLGKGSRGEFIEGGFSYAILHNVKNQSIYLDRDYDIEKAVELSKWILRNKKCDSSACCQQLQQLFPTAFSTTFQNWEDIAKAALFQDRKKAAHSILYGENPAFPHQSHLPPYNVEVYEPNLNSSNPSLELQNRMRDLLKPTAPNQVVFPVTLGFCPVAADDGNCEGKHAVTVTGVRKLCCGAQCTEEWKIKNSYGGKSDGWFKAKPLSDSAALFRGGITSIRPCRPPTENSSKSLPVCEQHILGPNPLKYLAQAGDEKGFEEFHKNLGPSFDINAVDSHERTILIHAIGANKPAIVEYLIKNQSNPHLKARSTGYTPLHDASDLGFPEIVQILIRNKKEVNAETKSGLTPIHLAAAGGHLKVVKLLSKSGADINKTDERGLSPISLAAAKGRIEVVQYLKTQGGNVNQKDRTGNTAIHAATINGQLEMVKVLIENGADINQVGQQGFTPLNIAAAMGNFRMVSQLLAKGADLEIPNEDGLTPLAVAVGAGDYNTVTELLDSGADPLANANGQSILDIANSPLPKGSDPNLVSTKNLIKEEIENAIKKRSIQ